MVDKKCILSFVSRGGPPRGRLRMTIRLLALVGLLGVLGTMVSAERSTNQTAMLVQEGSTGQAMSVEDPYPPPTPRP
jgi:hypothetical protein